jgi:hypothetical protein
MASALAQLSSEAVLDDPQPPEVYGLDADEREVRFGAGGEEFALRTGDKTPVGGNAYASVGGSDAVYIVESYRINALQKELDDLRDKRILRFDTAAIDRLTASWPGGRVAVALGDDGWQLEQPIQGRADDETIDSLLSDLSFLRADGFVDEPLPDVEAGLDRLAYQVELLGEAGGEGEEPLRLRLAIGESLDGESRLVRAAGASLYRIPAERIADFPRELVQYRFRQVAKFLSSDAERLELVFHPNAALPVSSEPLRITATRDETGWTSSPERFAAGKIARLVSELSRLRAEGILADSLGSDELRELALSPPSAVLRVFGEPPEEGEGEDESGVKLAGVEIGSLRGDQWILARSEGDEIVFQLDQSLAEHIPVSLEAFRNRFVAEDDEEAEEDAESELGLDDEDGLLSPEEESP